ncbi:cysteine desulfurase NifS [candidate division CSSED10-310 bacterium]|uniref:Cysteine desulfurase n=1 Tax=candidate division CSSED10-310 bacterium TaxID=2855610 RepID=A0ABV6Z504_UNCC1
MRTVYVDNNATTAIAPEVLQAMLPYFKENYFNPSSMYDQARGAADAVTRARQVIATIFGGIAPDEILFTSCATESNNTAILGAVKANPHKKHIITTAVEHPAVLEVCRDLQRNGYEVTFLPVDASGQIEIGDFISALRMDTLLVTIMHANNETGVIFPIADYARIVKETNPEIIFHTDATQTVGKLPIDLKNELNHIDMLSFSGHKLHAPKGVGALYIRRGTPCRPFLIGGHQEKGRRAGTENVPYIVGLATAVELAQKNHDPDEHRIKALRDRLEQTLTEKISYIEINGQGAPRLSNTLNVAIHYIEGEGILFQLNQHGICASSGSACTSGSLDPSHVLKAMHIHFTAAHGSVRFSLSRYNTEADIDHVSQVFPQVVANLRKMSPYWDQKNNKPREDIKLVDTKHQE